MVEVNNRTCLTDSWPFCPFWAGPVVSQLLLSDFFIDTIKVEPKQVTLVPGTDYMTTVDDWLDVQVC